MYGIESSNTFRVHKALKKIYIYIGLIFILYCKIRPKTEIFVVVLAMVNYIGDTLKD